MDDRRRADDCAPEQAEDADVRHSRVWSAQARFRFLRCRKRWQATALQSSAGGLQHAVVLRSLRHETGAVVLDRMPESVVAALDIGAADVGNRDP